MNKNALLIASFAAAILTIPAAIPCFGVTQHPPLALAVFAPDPHEYAFGARHAASGMGVPYFFTHDFNEALRQPMMIITGSVDATFVTDAATRRLHDYLTSGGVAIVDDGESQGIQALAGIAGLTPSEHRYSMTLDAASGDPGFAQVRLPEERTIELGNKVEAQAVLTQGYKMKPGTDARVLARFDDGTVALVEHNVGKGRIYVVGEAYFDSVLRPQNDQAIEAGRVYDNGFEPSADVPQMMIRDWYLHLIPGAVVTDPTPDGLSGALIITHDVDYIRSVANMLPYAKAEKRHGFSSTFFIQARTVHDVEDLPFFDASAKHIITTIVAEGADIASHTVSHSPDWSRFPLGTGNESPSNYTPMVKRIAPDHRSGLTLGGTVIGEIKVSKERIESSGPGIEVLAFRPGYLLINRAQWTVLEKYGYRYASSYAAGELMTSFPYAAMEAQGFTKESQILEFPIVLADADKWVPMLPHMAAFDKILDDEADMHGVVTTLIHDDTVADKLDTELALVQHARPKMWIGSIDAFGDFWNRRAQAIVTARPASGGGAETVSVTSPHGVTGLTLDFPEPVSAQSEGVTMKTGQGGTSVVLGPLAPGQTVSLQVSVKHP